MDFYDFSAAFARGMFLIQSNRSRLSASDINRGAVTSSITPHWRRRRLCGGCHPHPRAYTTAERLQTQPPRHCTDVVLASQVEAIRNTIASRTKRKFVVLASQVQAIRNSSFDGAAYTTVVLAFPIKAIRNGYELVLGQHGCISLSN